MVTAQQFQAWLKEKGACEEARIWSKGKTAREAWDQCHRGDWLLWWSQKAECDLRILTKAKGECAKTVYHLMKDERSRKAVDVAIAFGEGRATHEELDAAYADADAADAADAAVAAAAAAYTAYTAYTAYAAYAAYVAAADAADAAAYTAYTAYADDAVAAYDDDAAAYAAAYARTKSRQQTADIVRSIIKPSKMD